MKLTLTADQAKRIVAAIRRRLPRKNAATFSFSLGVAMLEPMTEAAPNEVDEILQRLEGFLGTGVSLLSLDITLYANTPITRRITKEVSDEIQTLEAEASEAAKDRMAKAGAGTQKGVSSVVDPAGSDTGGPGSAGQA